MTRTDEINAVAAIDDTVAAALESFENAVRAACEVPTVTEALATLNTAMAQHVAQDARTVATASVPA
jgi:hypothetical protein